MKEKPLEKPILFCGEMVRAILEGRKNQTRRIIKPQLDCDMFLAWQEGVINCPYAVGRLWVRESWAQDLENEVFYRADHFDKPSTVEKWRPSIFMPRWASRINLTVKNIRVERVQEITEEDARAEGCIYSADPKSKYGNGYVNQYHFLWESINGKDSWKINSWVWIIEFEKE